MKKYQTLTITCFVSFGCASLVFYLYLIIKYHPDNLYQTAFLLYLTFLVLFIVSYVYYLKTKDVKNFLRFAVASSFIPAFSVFIRPIMGPLDLSWTIAFFAIVYMVLPIEEANAFMIPFFVLLLIVFLAHCLGICKLPFSGKEYLPFFLSLLLVIGICNSTLKSLTESLNFYKQSSFLDPLTGVLNRRGFMSEANKILALCKRHNIPLSALFIDIDDFKKINDIYGHAFGDAVLKELAVFISKNLRKSDIIGRYGGEEFVILLPKTDLRGAFKVADSLRSKIITYFEEKLGVKITISVGVASLENADEISDLIEKSDKAMYRSKLAGKNRTAYYLREA